MERRTPIYVICSPRPRVGKTLLARLLTEFVHGEDRSVVAFDVNYDDFALADWLPRHTAISNITHTRGQIALFDELIISDGTVKIVDVGAWPFERFFGLAHELGLFQEARRRALQPMILFMADQHRRSMQAYATLQERVGDFVLVPVCNEAVIREQQMRESFPVRQGAQLRIAALQPFLKKLIDRRGFSFDGFLRRRTDEETGLHAWIKSCFREFRELEMRLLLEEMKSALQFATADRQLINAPPGPGTRSNVLLAKRTMASRHRVKKLKKEARP
jgi:hypothetical protein